MIRILLTDAIIISLVLLGWGIHDWAGFFDSLVPGTFLAEAVVAMTIFSAIIQEPVIKGTRTPSGQSLVLILIQIIMVCLLIFLPYSDRRGILVMNGEWLRWLGLVIVLTGHITTISAVHSLGRNYSVYVTIQEQHQLTQSGVYGLVRNPIYLGYTLSWTVPALYLVVGWLYPCRSFFRIRGLARRAGRAAPANGV